MKSSQFCHPGYNTFACNDSSAKSIQKLSNISIKTKHKIDDENYKSSDEDSKSNEKIKEIELSIFPRKTRQELKNIKTMKLEKSNFKSPKKNKTKFGKHKKSEETFFQIEKMVNDLYIENKEKKFDISKFEVVKPENLISIEKNDKSFFNTNNNVQQNFNIVPLRNFEGDGSVNITNNNITNNITIYRKETNRKKSLNDDNLIEDNKEKNNENIIENNNENKDVDLDNKKIKKNDKKKSIFCCL